MFLGFTNTKIINNHNRHSPKITSSFLKEKCITTPPPWMEDRQHLSVWKVGRDLAMINQNHFHLFLIQKTNDIRFDNMPFIKF